MGYNSSGLNIVLERLLLATRRPSTHYPLASGAAFFDPLRAICRWAINHLNTRHNIWRLPASHLPSFCAAPGDPLHSIRHLAACHPLAPAPHPSALCMPSAVVLRSTWRPPAQHPPSRCVPSSGPCAASVGSLHAICPPVHRAIPASPSQTIRHLAARHPLAPCRQSAGTNRCP